MKRIAEDIEVSWGERVAFLSDLFKETDETLKTFRGERQKMAKSLWEFLTSDKEARERLVKALRGKNKRELLEMAEKLAQLLKEHRTAIKSEVKKMLSDFTAEHEERSKELHRELAAFQKALRSAVKEMRAPIISDLKTAKQHWQNLAKIMAAKRAGKRKIEVPKRVEKAAEKAFTEGELKVRVQGLIEESPKGISLKQMGRKFGVPYIRLAKPIRELLDEGEVVRKKGLYFPAE